MNELEEIIERETGGRFTRDHKILCPFHNEKTPSLSVKYNADKDKEFFKCFGCGESGDKYSFIQKYKNFSFKEAKEYFGESLEPTEYEKRAEAIAEVVKRSSKYAGHEIRGTFDFYDDNNNYAYSKVKIADEKGKKQTPYLHEKNGKIIWGKADKGETAEDLPYCRENLKEAIRADKKIAIVEGEKDVNTLNKLTGNNVCSVSFKNVKNEKIKEYFKGGITQVFVFADTGEAGRKYRDNIINLIKDSCTSLKKVNLPNIIELGDNKDVTDYYEAGHSRQEIIEAMYAGHDVNNKYCLQEDSNGIYKFIESKDSEGNSVFKKLPLTDFLIENTTKVINEITGEDCMDVTLYNPFTGLRRNKRMTAKDLTDNKSFSMFTDISYSWFGKSNNLTELKQYLDRYKVERSRHDYVNETIKYNEDTDTFSFITYDGAIDKNGNIDTSVFASEGNIKGYTDIESINKQLLEDLAFPLFTFQNDIKSLLILGSCVSAMFNAHNEKLGRSQHVTLIAGESGSGKSTVLENVVTPLLNMDRDDIGTMDTTPFSLLKRFSSGNYACLMDEYKPSQFKPNVNMNISDLIRNMYNRRNKEKGQKSLSVRKFKLNTSLIMAGEESFYKDEKALIERSVVISVTTADQNSTSTESINYIKSHQTDIRKLGKACMLKVLGTSLEDYKALIDKINSNKNLNLENRQRETAINIVAGLEIINKIYAEHGLVFSTLEDNILAVNIAFKEENEDRQVLSAVDQTLVTLDEYYSTNSDLVPYGTLIKKEDGIYLALPQLSQFIGNLKKQQILEFEAISQSNFQKQAKAKGYLDKASKTVRAEGSPRPTRAWKLMPAALSKLNLSFMVDVPHLQEVVKNNTDQLEYVGSTDNEFK